MTAKTSSLPDQITDSRPEAIVMGVSAGAVESLNTILPKLPSPYPLPIMIVVHLPPDRKSVLAELFRSSCKLKVREVEDKEPLEPDTIYFAPPDYHLLVESKKQLALSSEEPVQFSRPSIDVLFESAADIFDAALIAIVLSGANNDGSRGAQIVQEANGIVIVQKPETALATQMPQAALEACPAARIMNLREIAEYLISLGDTV